MAISLLGRKSLSLVCFGSVAAATLGPTDGGSRVPVRQPEGVTHGYVVLTTLEGDTLAWGDQVETLDHGAVRVCLTLRFTDGSVHDERARFTQDGTFRLLDYALTQRGPAFPTRLDATLDAGTGAYRVESRDWDADESKVDEGTLDDLPDDVYNGMMPIIVKNVGDTPTSVHVVAFVPGPQTVEVKMRSGIAAAVRLGDEERPVRHWVLDPDLGFVKGAIALLIGRAPPDNHIWIATGDAPAFLRFQGPLYPGGPVWRIDQTLPRWP
jgi:hypothetical protein